MGLFQPIKNSPVLRALTSWRTDSVESRLTERLAEAEARANQLGRERDLLESRLIEKKKPGRTGISEGWSYSSKDMDSSKHSKLRKLAESAHTSHPLAKKALRLKRSMVCSEGYALEALSEDTNARERVQTFLDEHYAINWEETLEKRVETLSVLGELCFWLPPPNSVNGQYQIGGIDSDSITQVCSDPLNRERALEVEFSSPLTLYYGDKKVDATSLPIVQKCWKTGRYSGELLYIGVNTLSGRHRGLSDLTPVVDFLEVFDQLLWTEAERVKMLRSLMFQYKMNGVSDPATLRKKEQEMRLNPPPPGSWIVTNESVQIEEICPTLNTAPSLEFIKYVFGLVSGCLDLPEHYYYSSGDVNRASAREMTDPVYASVRDRKKTVARMLHMEHAIALQRASKIEGSAVYGLTSDQLEFHVTSRDPERDALSVIGQHITALGQALVIGKHEGWISEDQAGSVFRQELSGLGLGELEDPNEEVEQVEECCITRNIDGKPENFPLSLDESGGQAWAYSA